MRYADPTAGGGGGGGGGGGAEGPFVGVSRVVVLPASVAAVVGIGRPRPPAPEAPAVAVRNVSSSRRRAPRRRTPAAITRQPSHNRSIETAPAPKRVIGRTVSCSPVAPNVTPASLCSASHPIQPPAPSPMSSRTSPKTTTCSPDSVACRRAPCSVGALWGSVSTGTPDLARTGYVFAPQRVSTAVCAGPGPGRARSVSLGVASAQALRSG